MNKLKFPIKTAAALVRNKAVVRQDDVSEFVTTCRAIYESKLALEAEVLELKYKLKIAQTEVELLQVNE
jgi:hypothetical protein